MATAVAPVSVAEGPVRAASARGTVGARGSQAGTVGGAFTRLVQEALQDTSAAPGAAGGASAGADGSGVAFAPPATGRAQAEPADGVEAPTSDGADAAKADAVDPAPVAWSGAWLWMPPAAMGMTAPVEATGSGEAPEAAIAAPVPGEAAGAPQPAASLGSGSSGGGAAAQPEAVSPPPTLQPVEDPLPTSRPAGPAGAWPSSGRAGHELSLGASTSPGVAGVPAAAAGPGAGPIRGEGTRAGGAHGASSGSDLPSPWEPGPGGHSRVLGASGGSTSWETGSPQPAGRWGDASSPVGLYGLHRVAAGGHAGAHPLQEPDGVGAGAAGVPSGGDPAGEVLAARSGLGLAAGPGTEPVESPGVPEAPGGGVEPADGPGPAPVAVGDGIRPVSGVPGGEPPGNPGGSGRSPAGPGQEGADPGEARGETQGTWPTEPGSPGEVAAVQETGAGPSATRSEHRAGASAETGHEPKAAPAVQAGSSQAHPRLQDPAMPGSLAQAVSRRVEEAVRRWAEQAASAHPDFGVVETRLGDGGQEVTLRLHPPELGELRFYLTSRAGQLSVSVGAERPETGLLLQRHLGALQQALEQAGLRLGDVSVQVGAGPFGRGRQDEEAPGSRRSAPLRPLRAVEADGGTPGPRMVAPVWMGASHVDLRV